MNFIRPAIATLTLLLWVAPANAGTVAIVRPNRPTPDVTETVSRIHGELLAVGLEVRTIDPPLAPVQARTNSPAWLRDMATAGEIDAVIDIVGQNTPVWVDVWIIEKLQRRFELTRIANDPNTANASERLAIRAIEVLRSSFLESDMSGRKPDREPIAKPTSGPLRQAELPEVTRRPKRIGVELGAAVLTSMDGLGPALLPMARFDWTPSAWLILHGELVGLGTRPAVATTAGHARVAQQYGALGGSFRFRSDRRLNAFIGFSAGALRTAVTGAADAPRLGHASTQWSLLLDGNIGAALELLGRYYLTLAAHVQVAEPYIALHIMDAVVATSGRPNLALTLTVGAWL